jgi:hypothetical protein
MNTTAEAFPEPATAIDFTNDKTPHLLALVQGDLIIVTFPEDQLDAAIDLARVLCRALRQPVDLFRVSMSAAENVQAGANVHAGPGWAHLAHLHITLSSGVEVDVRDPSVSNSVALQQPNP